MWILRTSGDRMALLARLALVMVMFPHGAQKAFGWFGGDGFRGTVASMTGDGLPVIVPIAVMAVEVLGSAALVLGLLGRVVAAAFAGVMVGAIALVQWPHGFFMNWLGQKSGEGFEYHLLVLVLTVIVMARGSGPLSLDRALARRFEQPLDLTTETAVGLAAPDADPVLPRQRELSTRY